MGIFGSEWLSRRGEWVGGQTPVGDEACIPGGPLVFLGDSRGLVLIPFYTVKTD
jgi:hypothetical protein